MAHDELVCPSCGNLRSICSDPDVDWHPHTNVCWAAATRDLALRHLHDKHKATDPSPHALHPTDGLSVFVAQTPPPEGEDEFRFL